ncbi:unnamed protein product [Linum trigynum]|uniref:Uncharacterized protein n=1 Tax=Linum trigynum TaxID=586398 RepID=A0AAV2G6T7_9ROSI
MILTLSASLILLFCLLHLLLLPLFLHRRNLKLKNPEFDLPPRMSFSRYPAAASASWSYIYPPSVAEGSRGGWRQRGGWSYRCSRLTPQPLGGISLGMGFAIALKIQLICRLFLPLLYDG